MSNRFVYLAGPIMGQTRDGANDWRIKVADVLKDFGVIGVSPLRCEPLIGNIYGSVYDADPRFGTARAIASKNLFDVQNCDMTLAYFPREQREFVGHLSYGTIIEVGWANAYRKPTIVVTDDIEVINHPVLSAVAGWLVPDLEAGIDVVTGILGGYTGGKNV